MGSYELEDMHIVMSVLSDSVLESMHDETYISDEDIFERACMEVLLTCGPAPLKRSDFIGIEEYVRAGVATSVAMLERNKWIRDVEAFVSNRYHVRPSRLEDFIIAFETWYHIRKEDAEHDSTED